MYPALLWYQSEQSKPEQLCVDRDIRFMNLNINTSVVRAVSDHNRKIDARDNVLSNLNSKLPDTRSSKLLNYPFCRRVNAILMQVWRGLWRRIG